MKNRRRLSTGTGNGGQTDESQSVCSSGGIFLCSRQARLPSKAAMPYAFYRDFFAYLTMVHYFCGDKRIS